MYRYNNSKTILKALRKTDYSYQKQYRQHKHQKNKNNRQTKIGKKNISMDISKKNKAKSNIKKPGHG